MKNVNKNTNLILALISAAVLAISVPAKAEENGFTLEDSIRTQIFMELKSNVKSMYQNAQLLVPSVDTSIASSVASNNANSGFVLPASINNGTDTKDKAVENIN